VNSESVTAPGKSPTPSGGSLERRRQQGTQIVNPYKSLFENSLWARQWFCRSAPVPGRSSVSISGALEKSTPSRLSAVAAPGDGRTPTPDLQTGT
jgi:hypothetical protein